MIIQFKILNTKSDINTKTSATYASREYSLEAIMIYPQITTNLSDEIDKTVGVRSKNLQVVYGDLTITFANNDLRLKSIDSYTNSDKWFKQTIKIPSTDKKICLLVADPLTSDDRFSISNEPIYIFDDKNGCLLIKLDNIATEKFYHLSETLIVGLSGSKLSSILLFDLLVQK